MPSEVGKQVVGTADPKTDETREIPLETIYWPGPTDVTKQQISDMAASLLVQGQIEPIVVNVRDEKGYRGVIGRLRYEGMKDRWRAEPAGKTILTRIHGFADDVEIQMWQLAENLHRRELPAMEKARQYRTLYDLLKENHSEKATVGTLVMALEACTGNPESDKTVQHYLSLTKLQPKTQEILTSEKLPLRAGLELLRVENPQKQVKAAMDIQKNPERYKSIADIKYHVDSFVEDQRRDKQRKRLEKKAEEIQKQGKQVILEAPYSSMSYKEREKYHIFYGEVPAKCKTCPTLGVQLSGNFQQKPMCSDPKCHDDMLARKTRAQTKEQREIEQKFDVERAKVYGMEPDARHWRLAVFGLLDHWALKRILKVEKDRQFARDDEVVWLALSKLDEKQCQQLLIKHAVEKVLTEPQWGDETVKEWTVKEFSLTAKVFLKQEEKPEKELKKEDPPCTQCVKDGISCGREHFYRNDADELVCDRIARKPTKA